MLHISTTAGDIVKVDRGAKIPTDGTVVKGKTTVDESMMTGESSPVLKTKGSTLIGGSINLGYPIHVRVTGVGTDTVLFKIVQMVQQAQTSKVVKCTERFC